MQIKLSKVKEGIQNGDLESAGQQLLEFTQKHSSRFYNEVIGHFANLKQVIADERKGIANPETTKLNKNRITYALLDLIDDIDEEIPRKGSMSSKRLGEKDKDIMFGGSVGQVIIQRSNSGDNVIEKKEKAIEIGNNTQISAPIVIADSLEKSFNTLENSKINDDTKALLEQLLKAINEINKKAAPEHVELAESMARDVEALVKEATSSRPRRKWYEVSIEGLKQAASNIGEVATPVIDILGKISPLLLG